MSTEPPPGTTAENRVADDVRCVGCGYVLRGLDVDGRCPECNESIARALRGTHLVNSSSAYVRSLERGTLFVLLSIIIYAIGFVTLGPTIVILEQVLGMAELAQVLWGAAVIGALLVECFGLYGYWLFTAPDPAIMDGDRGTGARRVIRSAVAASAGLRVLITLGEFGSLAGITAAAIAASGLEFIAFIAFAVKFFATMLYARWLATRLSPTPGAEIDTIARRYLWLLPVLMVASCLIIPAIVGIVLYALFLNRLRHEISLVHQETMRRFGDPEPLAAPEATS